MNQPDPVLDVIRLMWSVDHELQRVSKRMVGRVGLTVARAIVRDEGEAEDVMQQAYMNAYANLGQFAGKARFSTWLTRIAINESLSRARRRGKYEPFDDKLSNGEPFMAEHSSPDPERQTFTGELRALLEWAIDGLADGAREVFVTRSRGLQHGRSGGIP